MFMIRRCEGDKKEFLGTAYRYGFQRIWEDLGSSQN